ncbi:MAG: LPP20 family lipoprotein [SAR324 cluster bacterium]|nr:LPP20 family lipoprotein [SAR324 cluster bacterium]
MKSKWIIFPAIWLITACSSSNVVPEGTKVPEQPEWIQTLGIYPQGIGTIGSAPRSPLGTQAQRNEAIMVARNQLAGQLQTIVQNASTQSQKQLLESSPTAAKVIASSFTEVVMRQIVNQTLTGSMPIRQWIDPMSNELYVWVVIDENNLVPRIQAAMRQQLKGESKDHQKALETMDEQIQKAIKLQKQQ